MGVGPRAWCTVADSLSGMVGGYERERVLEELILAQVLAQSAEQLRLGRVIVKLLIVVVVHTSRGDLAHWGSVEADGGISARDRESACK